VELYICSPYEPSRRGQGKHYRHRTKVKLLIQGPVLWSQLQSAKFILTSNDRIGFDEELVKDMKTDSFIHLVSEMGRLGLLAAMLTIWFIQVRNVGSTINRLESKLQMFCKGRDFRLGYIVP